MFLNIFSWIFVNIFIVSGGNYRLATRMRTRHPSIYKFIMIIKEELENSFFKSNQAIEGVVERRRNKRTTTVMKTRCKLKDLLFSNGITLGRFMRAMGALNSRVITRSQSQSSTSSMDSSYNAISSKIKCGKCGKSYTKNTCQSISACKILYLYLCFIFYRNT